MTDLVFDTFSDSKIEYEITDWQQEDINNAGDEFSADWSEMGCYKTTSTLWLAQQRNVKNVLIITSQDGKGTYFDAVPKSLDGWCMFNVTLKTCEQYIGPDLWVKKDLNLLLDQVRMGHHSKPWIFLIHYDCFSPKWTELHRIAERFSKVKWDIVACDEAHRLKNRDTGWTKVIKKNIRAHHRRIMTGTGFVNNPAEMWSLLNFLDPRGKVIPRATSYWAFRNHFCDEIITGANIRQIVGIRAARKPEFIHLRKSLGPRHNMTEVHPNIIEPITTQHDIDLSVAQRRMYNEIKSMLQTLDRLGEPITSPNVVSQLSRLRQICTATPKVVHRQFDNKVGKMITKVELEEPSAKLDKVMELLEDIAWDDEAKRQVVIFSNFRGPLNLLEKRFEEQVDKRGRVTRAAIPYIHLKREMSANERYRLWHDVFPQKKHRVIMATIALGGESINLTPANYMIFLDRSWSPKDMMQAVGRVYRPGQKEAVEVIHINARNTVDKRIIDKLATKQKWFDEIFGS